MTFGELLKKHREDAGLTQAALAEKTGISLRTIQGWERGARSPISPDFFVLVKALGVPAEAYSKVRRGEGK